MSFNTKNYSEQGGDTWVVNGVLKIKGSDIAAIVDGNCFYVDSGSGSDSNSGENWDEALATIDAAVGKCTANNGDRIYVSSAHAETLTGAGGITCDVAGVEIVGVGQGNDRGTITFSTSTGASILITAASVKIRNLIGVAGIDGLTNPIHIQAAGADVEMEWRDGSATVEAARVVLTTSAADNLKLRLKHRGFTGGNAVVNSVRLVGVDNADIWIDFYGVASTGVVEFHTTACTNVKIRGYSYVAGTSDYSLIVVDTVGSSTWSFEGWDGEACSRCSGGQDAAIAGDDVGAVSTAVAALQADVGNPSARTNLQTLEAMLGNPDTAAQSIWDLLAGAGGIATFPAGAAAANDVSLAEVIRYIQETCLGVPTEDLATDALVAQVVGKKSDTVAGTSIVSLVKQALAALVIIDAFHDVPTADSADNVVMSDVLGNKTDTVAGDSAIALLKQLLVDTSTTIPAQLTNGEAVLGTPVTFAAADVLDSVQNTLFTISGGRVLITNIVLEISGAAVDAQATTTKLIYSPTTGTDTDLCTTADLNAAIVGTILGITGTLSDALQFAANGGLVSQLVSGLQLKPGTIDIQSGADSGTGGALVSAKIWYLPLDSGATIA